MKKLLFSIALGTVSFCCLSAQSVSYPESFKAEFEKADAQCSAGKPSTPLIGLPLSSVGSAMEEELRAAGASVVYVNANSKTDFPALRDLCSSLDGFVIDPNFASSPDILLLKALTDRNVPVLGTCAALDSINVHARRLDYDIKSSAELVSKAKVYKRARQLMSEIIVADTHCDLPMYLVKGSSLGERSRLMVSLPKMEEGGQNVMFLGCFIGQKPITPESNAKAIKDAHDMIESAKANIARYSDFCALALTPEDALDIKASGRKAMYLAIENGFAIGNDISLIKEYSKLGVICMTICHSLDNAICGTSNPKSQNGNAGLTPFGRKVIREMNRCGMMIDLSHASEKTFFDVVALSKAPVICTHSGCSALYKHNRSLTDEQLLALKKNGGVIHQILLGSFMSDDGSKITIDDMIAHIKHVVEVAGIDHVGIGSDFDGGGGARGYNGCNDYVNICVRLMEEGFSDSDITKIFGGNLMRIMAENQKLAR